MDPERLQEFSNLRIDYQLMEKEVKKLEIEFKLARKAKKGKLQPYLEQRKNQLSEVKNNFETELLLLLDEALLTIANDEDVKVVIYVKLQKHWHGSVNLSAGIPRWTEEQM